MSDGTRTALIMIIPTILGIVGGIITEYLKSQPAQPVRPTKGRTRSKSNQPQRNLLLSGAIGGFIGVCFAVVILAIVFVVTPSNPAISTIASPPTIVSGNTQLPNPHPNLEQDLLAANIILSKTSDAQADSVRRSLDNSGYSVLARNCLIVLSNKRLVDPVALDVINRFYKEAIGKTDKDNLELDEYNDLSKYEEAIFGAWQVHHSTTSDANIARKSFDDIVQPRTP